MVTISGQIWRDENRVPIQGLSLIQEKQVTFATASTGAIGQHDLFTVTGDVLISVFAVVNTTLTSGGAATISIGTANNVAAIIDVTAAPNLADGDVWVDSTDTRVEVGPLPSTSLVLINDGADITYDVLADTIDTGQIDFYCLWRPLSEDGNVIAA